MDKKIPKDIAVVGYVSERMAPYLSPELTTINQHSFTMGKTAANLLIDQLESKDVNNQTVVINSTLSKDLLLRLICDFLQYLTNTKHNLHNLFLKKYFYI